jgi:hypothetical protein
VFSLALVDGGEQPQQFHDALPADLGLRILKLIRDPRQRPGAMPSPVRASSSAWSLELALCTVDHLADPMRNGSDPPPKGATPGIAVLSDVALIAVNAP